MHAFIITGGTREKRHAWTRGRIAEWKAEKFDIIEITPEEISIGITEIRDFCRRLSLAPRGPLTVGIINQADGLTIQAQNALLKTLEEPPLRARIILEVQNPAVLLPTIISRALITNLAIEPSFSPEEHQAWLDTRKELAGLSAGKQLQITNSIVTNLESASRWVACGIEVLHENLTLPTADEIRKLLDAHVKLASNVTPKLVIDSVVLEGEK